MRSSESACSARSHTHSSITVVVSYSFPVRPSVCLSVCLSVGPSVRPSVSQSVSQSVRPSVRPSVRLEQLGSHWTDFYEIWYVRLFRKSVEKIQDSLKSDKNNGYFTWRHFHIYDNISLITVSNKSFRENQDAHFIFSDFFPKIVPFMR
jgi:hypothetical protein